MVSFINIALPQRKPDIYICSTWAPNNKICFQNEVEVNLCL